MARWSGGQCYRAPSAIPILQDLQPGTSESKDKAAIFDNLGESAQGGKSLDACRIGPYRSSILSDKFGVGRFGCVRLATMIILWVPVRK